MGSNKVIKLVVKPQIWVEFDVDLRVMYIYISHGWRRAWTEVSQYKNFSIKVENSWEI